MDTTDNNEPVIPITPDPPVDPVLASLPDEVIVDLFPIPEEDNRLGVLAITLMVLSIAGFIFSGWLLLTPGNENCVTTDCQMNNVIKMSLGIVGMFISVGIGILAYVSRYKNRN